MLRGDCRNPRCQYGADDDCKNPIHKENIMWKQYRRLEHAELRPYVVGEDLTGISVSANDTPKLGDMIARNPKIHGDQWLVAAAYFGENFEEV